MSISILCHGDSITRGYYDHGWKHHPYSRKLGELLKDHFHSSITFNITTQGINGETTASMLKRLEKTFSETKTKYDCLVVLGGLNDLGDETPDLIAQNLCDMVVLGRKNVKNSCVLISVPNCYPDRSYSKYREAKDAVNKRLKEYVDKQNGSLTPRVHFLDLTEHGLDFFAMDDKQRSLIYDDNIHYTPEGYDLLGSAVFNVLKSDISV
ncbi:unnamed protein product [Didymodactylos carnosus]|uniref:SGNH hydrolase-type esterase domain-containing protein n=1 Tax=Didymodactylos carnosus TaxID=1234261 RepID=A0A814RX37_9BILA|nr:unnamed protein product [Didymodactylos carnosus]CAF1139102.1 unnamed protein product [Didymodactylos carnosus]CAF3701465.1 unnamed protein product [Didymodactylos carnosus]CAF3902818.1 unnamed protein product [Didymodactylos carnosus]